MDFAFSEEQEMLRDQARSFLSSKFGHERVAELAASDEPWDRDAWREMAGLGWIGLSLPEDEGGAGMGFLEEAVLFEEMGKACLPAPYFSTVGLALPLLRRSRERVLAGEAAATLAWQEPGTRLSLADLGSLSTKAEGSGENWTLTGEKALVPDLAAADVAVVAAATPEGPGLFEVDVADADTSVDSTMDGTRRLGRLKLNGTPASLVASAQEASSLLENVRSRALAALSLEAVGVAQTALDLAREYVTERKQFEKPIGSYQAVSHQVANTYMEVELARSLAYWAAWCVAEKDDQAPAAVAAAKAAASEAAVNACERSIQVHGGIGFTWEHVLHRYYKRAQWIDAFEGSSYDHRKAVAAAVLG